MGIALPWEQAVRDHNANQPADVIVHFVRLCLYASVKGALTAPYFLVAHARSTLGLRFFDRTLPAFFGNNRRKNGELPRTRYGREFERLPCARRSRLSFLPFFFLSSNTNRADYSAEHMFLDVLAASSLI